jgi:phospholipid transport system substrate-binding protein
MTNPKTDHWRRVLVAMLGALLVAGPTLAADTPSSTAREVVETTLGEVLAALNAATGTEDSRRDRITDIAYAHFDFDTMSKLVIARPWRKFTKEQRAAFIDEFKVHLARSYGRRLARYEGVDVQVVSEIAEQRGDITVHSKVVGGQFDGAKMDYRMRGKTGEWLVIDVIIEGVSLVSNFRSQFKPIVAEGGAEELLRRLKDKNDVLQVEIQAEEQGGEALARPVSDTAESK